MYFLLKDPCIYQSQWRIPKDLKDMKSVINCSGVVLARLFEFYGLSIIVGYLMPNLFLY